VRLVLTFLSETELDRIAWTHTATKTVAPVRTAGISSCWINDP